MISNNKYLRKLSINDSILDSEKYNKEFIMIFTSELLLRSINNIQNPFIKNMEDLRIIRINNRLETKIPFRTVDFWDKFSKNDYYSVLYGLLRVREELKKKHLLTMNELTNYLFVLGR